MASLPSPPYPPQASGEAYVHFRGGARDKVFSQLVPAGFAATGLYLVVKGLHSLYTDTGKRGRV